MCLCKTWNKNRSVSIFLLLGLTFFPASLWAQSQSDDVLFVIVDEEERRIELVHLDNGFGEILLRYTDGNYIFEETMSGKLKVETHMRMSVPFRFDLNPGQKETQYELDAPEILITDNGGSTVPPSGGGQSTDNDTGQTGSETTGTSSVATTESEKRN